MSDYSDLLDVAVSAVEPAAETMRRRSPGALTQKGDRDMASELDYEIEHAVRQLLQEATPEIGFVGEESSPEASGDLQWVLDPIDGTANFVRGVPLCAISLGLLHQGAAVLGVIELPFLGGRYTAAPGKGARFNDDVIGVSNTTHLTESIVAIGDYAVGDDAPAKNRRRLALTSRLADRAQRVRMTGSAALDLGWLAHGKIDAALTLSNHLWDMTAGVAIARQAGAVIMDLDGSRHGPDSSATLAVAPGIADDMLTLVRQLGPADV